MCAASYRGHGPLLQGYKGVLMDVVSPMTPLPA
jgi:hypothetical protein